MDKQLVKWLKKGREFFFLHPLWKPHLNGRDFWDITVQRTLLLHGLILVWFFVLTGIGKTWLCNYNQGIASINDYFDKVERLLSEEYLVNILLTITIFIVVLGWLIHVWRDQYLSLVRIDIAICLIAILTFVSVTFTNVYSAIGLDYFNLLCMVLISQLLIEGKKLWNKRWGVASLKYRKVLRYITEQPQIGLDLKVRTAYAERVSEWLLNTDISKSAFAVGITSEWGSGKSSFLLDMQKILKDKCYMVDFKPWHCQEPDQIVNEFFELLRNHIRVIYSPLQKPIIRYVHLLSDVDLPKYVSPLFNLLPDAGHSIEEYKSKIEEGLKQIDKPIVVAIDDMDRLAADEMFEVLRLIRNTAAFPNLIYVVCYDKDYVVRQIQNKGITESDLYLEKIFPLELSLPKTEEEALIETFRRALIDMHFLNGKHDSLRSRLTLDDERLMVRLLPTYRKIKRFARVLMTNTMFVMEKVGRKNIDLYDIFLIELLHFCMQDVYAILRDRPEDMLEVKMEPGTKQARYVLKKDVLSDESCEMLFNRVLSIYEKELIEKCFEVKGGDKIHFLSYVDSYQNYFCLATPDAVITKKEFDDVLIDRSTIRKNVHDWFWKVTPKKSNSLYSKMMGVRTKELTQKRWEDHVYLLLSWLCEDDYGRIKDVLMHFLQVDNLHRLDEDEKTAMKQFVQLKLMKMVEGLNVDRFSVARNLSGYCHAIKDNRSEYLLNVSEMGAVLITNFKKFMSEKLAPQDAINVVALNGNDVHEFVKAHDIAEYIQNEYGTHELIHTNYIINEVINYFGAYKDKSTHLKDAKEIYGDGGWRYKSLAEIDGNLRDEKYAIFENDENYERFLKECFVVRNEKS